MPGLSLIRHAEPSVQGVLLGRSNPGLSERGRQAASTIEPPPAVILYTSTLIRALETAEIVWRGHSIRHVILGELDEIGYGAWDGLSWETISAQDPVLAEAKLADWKHVTPPGGEPWSSFESRVRQAWRQIRTGPLPACVVAHSAVNAVLAGEMTGRDPLTFHQNHGEILTYEF